MRKINPKEESEPKRDEINLEEIREKAGDEEDREDDPEDMEEFFDEKGKVSKVAVQEESSFGFLPEKHKIEVYICGV